MIPTPEMREAAHNAWKDTVVQGKSAEAATECALTAALALIPRETRLYGPYGYLNGCRALTEDTWTLENDPLENSDEYFSIPLFAKVDVSYPVSAAPAPLPVAVKGLEWIAPSKSTNYCWIAKSPFGTYSVVDEDGWYAAREPGDYWEWNGDRIIDTRDSAFRACETDYETKIRSALCDVSPTPASDIAALREENERLREALRPFSAEADHYRDSAGGVLIESGMGDVRDAKYNISDLRRARTLVNSALQHVAKGERG